MAATARASAGEDKTAVIELASKIEDNASMMKQIEGQQRQLEIEIRRAAFTAAHLNELPENATTYRSLGKSYVHSICIQRMLRMLIVSCMNLYSCAGTFFNQRTRFLQNWRRLSRSKTLKLRNSRDQKNKCLKFKKVC